MAIIKLYASFRIVAGKKELSIPGSTLSEIIRNLENRSPSVKGLILEGNQLRQHVVVTLNGNPVMDLGEHVDQEDIVAVFPPIAGG